MTNVQASTTSILLPPAPAGAHPAQTERPQRGARAEGTAPAPPERSGTDGQHESASGSQETTGSERIDGSREPGGPRHSQRAAGDRRTPSKASRESETPSGDAAAAVAAAAGQQVAPTPKSFEAIVARLTAEGTSLDQTAGLPAEPLATDGPATPPAHGPSVVSAGALSIALVDLAATQVSSDKTAPQDPQAAPAETMSVTPSQQVAAMEVVSVVEPVAQVVAETQAASAMTATPVATDAPPTAASTPAAPANPTHLPVTPAGPVTTPPVDAERAEPSQSSILGDSTPAPTALPAAPAPNQNPASVPTEGDPRPAVSAAPDAPQQDFVTALRATAAPSTGATASESVSAGPSIVVGTAGSQAALEETTDSPGVSARASSAVPFAETVQSVEFISSPAGPAPRATEAISDEPRPAGGLPATDQIVETVRLAGPGVGRQITVRLDPPDLGRVRLTLESDGQEVRGVLEVDNPRTLVQLQRETSVLADRLADGGIQLRRLDVQLTNQDRGDSTGSSPQQGAHGGGDAPYRQASDAPDSERLSPAGVVLPDADDEPALEHRVADGSINVWM